MEILGRESIFKGEYEHIVHVYLTSEGTLTLKQKSVELDRNLNATGDKFYTLRYAPTFKSNAGSFSSFTLDYNSFRSFNDMGVENTPYEDKTF